MEKCETNSRCVTQIESKISIVFRLYISLYNSTCYTDLPIPLHRGNKDTFLISLLPSNKITHNDETLKMFSA